MNISNLIRIAFKALQRNKLRAFLTMLGIIIGVAAVIAMVAIGQGSKQSIHDQLSSMGSNMITVLPSSNLNGGVRIAGSSFQTLTDKDIVALKREAQYITEISPSLTAKGQAINGALNWPTSMQGVSPDYLDIRMLTLKDGIAFTQQDVLTSAKVCLIGQTVIDNLFPNGENPIGKVIRFNKIPFQVIGILNPKGQNAFGQDQDDILIAPYTTVQKRILATIYYQNIYASATNEAVTDAATTEMTSILRASHRLRDNEDNDFTVRTQAELINTLSSTSGLLTVLLTVIAGISLVIGGIGIMNIMYVSVTERTREIGLRMAIGARGKDIMLQFLMEAILISITGGIIGVILGIVSSNVVTLTLSWPTIVSESSVVLSFIVCAVTGIFFGYYPAQKASRLDPIEALRYE
ncbi:putative ABC transport system permease protein [Mucilaginibacter lappiensis]|uniref:ABC transport system permease protein n=1 Tax=Mucilaginibacter lappiensis TaxID=354630 RepID=A0ABR6PNP0_9SPHI|nr:ABC transporter permease [Mucilaginibacter lappiensis]MBB6111393.1 putative ABC transport system permease protein [Mucilaginibacter lappiensis]SIR78352.1 putative ABC transport system permease protein [Mucilaginibacter lappiensis]